MTTGGVKPGAMTGRVMLGVIADDFTGATDVASMLVRGGMRTVQVIGVPAGPAPADADAVVVALKSRTAPVAEAVAQSLAAWQWLREAGARQCYFKYCSTFDSTAEGNIGPVAEALMAATGARFTIACPAFPENGRTIFRGHLFVGDQLLSDSGMRDHPLTPMRNSNLVQVLQPQCKAQKVGLIRYDTVAQGVAAVRARVEALQAGGFGIAVADAVGEAHLGILAEAGIDWPLLTAGSGLAQPLPALYAARGWLRLDPAAARLGAMSGPAAVLAGSCSLATQAQVASWRSGGGAALALDAPALARSPQALEQALRWARREVRRGPVLIHSTLDATGLRAVQADLGVQASGALVEAALASLARALVEEGVTRLVVAGGETSGAVVQALGVSALRIGASICPGVPWTRALGREGPEGHEGGEGGAPLWLALKSGNFGSPAFFTEALAMEGA
jgi:uncharacterized protein YgbK (DUF1537 family)